MRTGRRTDPADRQTDIAKLIVASRNFSNAPNNHSEEDAL
jgi:hypothetical protein